MIASFTNIQKVVKAFPPPFYYFISPQNMLPFFVLNSHSIFHTFCICLTLHSKLVGSHAKSLFIALLFSSFILSLLSVLAGFTFLIFAVRTCFSPFFSSNFPSHSFIHQLTESFSHFSYCSFNLINLSSITSLPPLLPYHKIKADNCLSCMSVEGA